MTRAVSKADASGRDDGACRPASPSAEALGVPQNITIVDDGGNMLGYVRMDGAKLLSAETSKSKAITAASHRQPTSRLDPDLEVKAGYRGRRPSDQSRRRIADRHRGRVRRRGRRRLGYRPTGYRSRARRAGGHRSRGPNPMNTLFRTPCVASSPRPKAAPKF